MRRTSLSLVAGLAATLIVSTAPAQAAVTAKDAPKQADIVKAFPQLADGQFTTDKTKQVSGPGSTCGAPQAQKVKSAVLTTGVSSAGTTIVQAGVAELASKAKAKAYVASYKKYVKKCSTFTEPTTGATITVSLGKSLKLGDASVTVEQQTTFSGTTTYTSSVVILDGKRVGNVAAIDAAAIPASAVKSLAKVTAKKMK
jgi:hypothetical protein